MVLTLEAEITRTSSHFLSGRGAACHLGDTASGPASGGRSGQAGADVSLTCTMARTTASRLCSFSAATQIRPESTP